MKSNVRNVKKKRKEKERNSPIGSIKSHRYSFLKFTLFNKYSIPCILKLVI